MWASKNVLNLPFPPTPKGTTVTGQSFCKLPNSPYEKLPRLLLYFPLGGLYICLASLFGPAEAFFGGELEVVSSLVLFWLTEENKNRSFYPCGDKYRNDYSASKINNCKLAVTTEDVLNNNSEEQVD